ncbi:hypothetical protein BJ742DRAFT_811357 [Cladochytrium replicatum]|nr:hypothetical protein BJ742DRAFT_811357 [Cladochytrium replicatum]
MLSLISCTLSHRAAMAFSIFALSRAANTIPRSQRHWCKIVCMCGLCRSFAGLLIWEHKKNRCSCCLCHPLRGQDIDVASFVYAVKVLLRPMSI